MNDAPATTSATVNKIPRTYRETIGDTEWELEEALLDVHDEVALWSENPRLQTSIPIDGYSSETELESRLQTTKGYEGLRKSIDDLGQMTPVYVQLLQTGKHLVIEGSTRVCILRQLDRKHQSGLKQGTFRRVKAKLLPANFGDKDVAVLLASIHVRGSGVRDWERYIQAKFVHETVVGGPGKSSIMNEAQLARYMGKSEAWVNRLKHAYEFSLRFIEHVDDDNGKKIAARKFSTLEEISKAKTIGSQLRDYHNPEHDALRDEVFTMVESNVFKEYRDARFLKDFFDDPDKWAQLKSGEEHVAHRLASEIQSNHSGPRAKIANIPQMVRRSIEGGRPEFDDDDVAALQQAINYINDQIHEGIRPFRVELKKMSSILCQASMADVKALERSELDEFFEALGYFQDLVKNHARPA